MCRQARVASNVSRRSVPSGYDFTSMNRGLDNAVLELDKVQLFHDQMYEYERIILYSNKISKIGA